MKRWQKIAVGMVILATMVFGLWEYRWDLPMLEQAIRAHPFLGAALYVILVITSIVVLPLSSLPLLPLATRIFGVWMTAILSVVGWWIGCLIAFQIARMGRQFMERFISFQAMDRIEKNIPPDINFAGIVILRMILPVDVVSFALGLLKNLTFSTYAIASLIGIIPFAFVWSYVGGEIERGQFLAAALALILMVLVVHTIRSVWKGHNR